MQVKIPLEDAGEFLNEGARGLEEDVKGGDQSMIRDAAEKPCYTALSAVNALMLHRLDVLQLLRA